MQITQLLTRRIQILEEALISYQGILARAPEGSLGCQLINGKWHYYHRQYINKKLTQKYLREEESMLASKLAEKSYAKKCIACIQKELRQLYGFIETYDPQAGDNILSSINPGAAAILEPISDIDYKLDRAWTLKSDQSFSSYKSNLIFQSRKGDLVRSKSELMIADDLYFAELLYQYEKALHLSSGITLHPDFTSVGKDGNIYYWEHVGGLENPEYASDFLRKMYLYAQDGIIPGKNLILSFESQKNPLTPGQIHQLMDYYLL